MPRADDPVLEVENLRAVYSVRGVETPVLNGVTFAVPRGKTLALVGESGSGKTLTAQAILRLIAPPGAITGGRVRLHPARGGAIEISDLAADSEVLFELRGGLVSMVFQEPLSALSPVHLAGDQVAEAIWSHRRITGREARRRALEMFASVGLPPEAFRQYPHQLSGGMRQRVLIAMALVCHPELLIADEPTTAMDVVTRRQILALLRRMQDEIGCSVLLITHDLGVVAEAADEVAVMSRGVVVEQGDVRSILREPGHPATQTLLLDWQRSFAGTGGGARSPSVQVSFRGEAPAPALGPALPLLSVQNLGMTFPPKRTRWHEAGKAFSAVEEVSFDLAPGETLALVGESGAGKTTTARCLLRALRPTAGRALLRLPDQSVLDLATASGRQLSQARRHAQMIFQDPFASLNPRMTVNALVCEPMIIHGTAQGSEREDRAVAMLRRVGLNPDLRNRYPHAFSGGQRQRVVIARALILNPSLVICDEATSSLDVGLQRQVLELLKELQRELGLTYLFIAHQLGIVREFCDRVAVMQAGRIVEMAPTERLFTDPVHPYTRLLLQARSTLEPQAPIPFPSANGAKRPSWAAG
jgi:peptide/nickel transport system ATP-binding protein